MDGNRFDHLARSLATTQSRRSLLRGLAGALAAGALGAKHVSAQQSCPPGQTANRKGDCRCPAATNACPEGCFNLKRDPTNCGACGHDCLGGECRKGECRCGAGTELCDGACFSESDYENDPNNCGSCGNVCDNGSCTGGSCCEPVCAGAECGADDGCGGRCFGSCPQCQVCDGFSRTCLNDTGPSCGSGLRCCDGQCAACLPQNNICLINSGACNNDCRLCCSGNSLLDPGGFRFCS